MPQPNSLADLEYQPERGPLAPGQHSLSDLEVLPSGHQPATLPDVTNQDIKGYTKTALKYAPLVGATLATLPFGGEGGGLVGAAQAVGAAAMGGATGSAVEQGGLKLMGDPDAPQDTGEALRRVRNEGAWQGAMEAGGRLAAWPVRAAGKRLFSPTKMYGRDLGVSTALEPSERRARVQTGLEEGIPLSEEGWEGKLRPEIQRVTGEMTGQVLNSPQAHFQAISPLDIADRVDQLAASPPWAHAALGGEDRAAMQRLKIQYLRDHGAQFDQTGAMVKPPNLMSPAEVLAEKQETYQKNTEAFLAAKKRNAPIDPARDATEKALARGGMERLIDIYPELRDLGLRDKSLIDLEDSLKAQIMREGNRNAIGLRATMAGGGALIGSLIGGPHMGAGAATLGLALSALDSPEVRSKLAIALYKASQKWYGKAAMQATPERAIPLAVRMGRAIFGGSQ